MSINTTHENINTWLSHLKEDYKVAISVDCVIFGYDNQELKVLLLESNMPPFEGQESLVGDLVRPSETLDDAAQRILEQRTGIINLYLEQVATFSDIDRHPLGRVISTAYYSLIKVQDYAPEVKPDGLKVTWKSIQDINQLAFDHNLILNTCLQMLQRRVREKPIGFSLLPHKFTLKQLQSLYEAILGIKLDKRNFRRKIKNSEILIEHSESQQDVRHRPAKYYSFNKENYNRKLEAGYSFDI
ncbi:MAG: NUDIX hydrolase [Saprospiraceae bacterium]|nr:NUDIX hydrolase [Saprospiraceae bacterium]